MKLLISRVANDGEGIGYYQSKPVFVYYAYKDEIVDIDLSINKRGAYEGKLNEIIKQSPHRVTPNCPYYGQCGGCNLMHINYFESLKYKKSVVRFLVNTNLRKISKNITINNTLPSPKQFNYRNHINVPVRYINNKNMIGLFYRGTNNFLPVEVCLVEEQSLSTIAKDILLLMDQLNIKGYNPKTNQGSIANLSIRSNLENEIQLTFVLKKKTNLTKLIKQLTLKHKNVVSIYENYCPTFKTNRDYLDGKLTHLYGKEELIMRLDNFQFIITPFAFFQLNTLQAINLYNMIIEKADLKPTDLVLDAYSGVGTIATFISPHVKKVVAIESVKDAVKAIEKSNQLNNIKNIKAITGDVLKVTDYLKQQFDVMIFDPPRTGLGKTIVNYIIKNAPKKVIYVSCNPETLVKDLNLLSEKYNILSIDPIDMFPQTSQIETLTILTLK